MDSTRMWEDVGGSVRTFAGLTSTNVSVRVKGGLQRSQTRFPGRSLQRALLVVYPAKARTGMQVPGSL